MKHTRLFSLISAIMLLSLVIASPVLAVIAAPDSAPTVQSMKFYRNLLETNDRLLVVSFNIPYALTPAVAASQTFVWQLIQGTDNVSGSVSGYSYVDSGYGYQSLAIYFDADVALAWDPVTAHTLRLQGTPAQFAAPLPQYSYTVTSASYSSLTTSADVKTELALDIIQICEDLDAAWGLTDSLLYEDDAGTVFSTFGQAYFRGNIPGIQSMAPSLFPLAIQNIENDDRAWSDNYSAALATQYSGTWVDTARAAQQALFGVDFNIVDLIIVFLAGIALIVANVFLTNDHWNGWIDAAFILVVFTRVGMYEMGYLILGFALCIIYIGTRIFKNAF